MKRYREVCEIDLDELTLDEAIAELTKLKEEYSGDAVLWKETRYVYPGEDAYDVWTVQVRNK
jgi:hypothetical protein